MIFSTTESLLSEWLQSLEDYFYFLDKNTTLEDFFFPHKM